MSDKTEPMTNEVIAAFVDMLSAAEKTAKILGQSVATTIENQLRMVRAIQNAKEERLRAMLTDKKVQ